MSLSVGFGLKKLVACLLLACCVLTSSGCGVKLLYNNADRLTRWWVSDYIDMTPEQREFLNASSAEILYWHRTTQLALYREQLLSLAQAISEPLTRTELLTYVERVEGWGMAINARAAPVALEMLLSLSAEQLQEFQRELVKSNRDYEKEANRPPIEQAEEDARDYISLLKRFTGRLSKEQRSYIEEQHAKLAPDAQVILDYRLHWQQRLVGALNAQPPDAALIDDLIINFDTHYTPEFAKMLELNEVIYQELTLGVLNGLTPKQRTRMAEELRDYAQLCAELMANAPSVAPAAPPVLVPLPVSLVAPAQG